MPKHPASDGSIKVFAGRTGKRRLLEAVKSQTLVSGSLQIAREAIRSSVIEEYQRGDCLMRQGEPENDIFLLVSGEVSVLVNRREVALRNAGTHVGEMALVDPLAKRSATVVAREHTIALRVPEYRFSMIAAKYPDFGVGSPSRSQSGCENAAGSCRNHIMNRSCSSALRPRGKQSRTKSTDASAKNL